MSRRNEPCLCGDPECPRCYAQPRRDEGDLIDDAYERSTQERLDDAAAQRRRKVYLGDAVYAQIEHDMLTLTTEDGISILNTVHLEPTVLDALLRYVVDAGWTIRLEAR